MKAHSQEDNGYDVDSVCGLHVERMLGNPPPQPHLTALPPPPLSMRSLVGLEDHHQHSISKQSQPQQSHGLMKHEQQQQQYNNRDPYNFVDEMPIACLPPHHHNNHHDMNSTSYVSQVKKRGRRKKPEIRYSFDVS